MTKQEMDSPQAYERVAVFVHLIKNLENNTKGFLESADLFYYPSFAGYLVAAFCLLKQAFCRKERRDFILIARCGQKRTF